MRNMESKIRELLIKMDGLNAELRSEYQRLAEKYGFSLKERTVVFLEKTRLKNRQWRIPAWRYAVPTRVRHVLSMPFIYAMIIPAVMLDIFLTVYNLIALPLYRIPRVRREEYFIYDRRFLDYLNIIQKANCLYCSYVNGLFAYATEIGARTERYWCPVKASQRPGMSHRWYKDFADYGNPEEWQAKFNRLESFVDTETDSRQSEKRIETCGL